MSLIRVGDRIINLAMLVSADLDAMIRPAGTYGDHSEYPEMRGVRLVLLGNYDEVHTPAGDWVGSSPSVIEFVDDDAQLLRDYFGGRRMDPIRPMGWRPNDTPSVCGIRIVDLNPAREARAAKAAENVAMPA